MLARHTALVPSLLLLGSAASLPAAPLDLRPCRVDGVAEELRCAELSVPEDWAKPGGRRIALHIVVVPALRPDPSLAPLFDLDGGPGMNVTQAAPFYATDGKAYRERRAVVLVDQRGTGRSSPLRCPQIEGASPLERMYPPEAVRRCREALTAQADLAQYTTAAAARDLDAVREALGAPRIDLSAISYGTRLGGFAAASAIVAGVTKAGGTDTEKLIAAMEGMSFETPKGTMSFRKEDHQALQPMYHWRMKKDQKGEWDLLELVSEIPAAKLPIPIRNK
jgi:hypothetical protein